MAIIVTPGNLRASLGGLALGALFSTLLSGVVIMQSILYYRLFSKDQHMLKSVVTTILFLDLFHTAMVWTATWKYFVESFGNTQITDHAFWSVGLSIALTAVTTLVVHCFFAYRLFKLSKGNYFLTLPIIILATCRLASAVVTAVELIRLASFSAFYEKFQWMFTLGLCLSTALDIMITTCLCLYLRKHHAGGSGRLDYILDSVTLYTVENGLLTSVATVVSLVFWLAKPHALIYLGLHFAISKLYSNSFLASMNARKLLRGQSQSTSTSAHRLPVIFAHHLTGRRNSKTMPPEQVDLTATRLQITVDKTVDVVEDDLRDITSQHSSINTKMAV